MGSMTVATDSGCLSLSACVVDWKSFTGRKASNLGSKSSAQVLKTSLRCSPFSFGFQVTHGDSGKPFHRYCRSYEADLVKLGNLRGKAFCMRESQRKLDFTGGFIGNVRAANKRAVGMNGAIASSTNTTVGEHEGNVPASKAVDDLVEQQTQLAMQKIDLLARWKPPTYIWRSVACLILAGQVIMRIVQGKIHIRNTIQQLESVGPRSLGVSLLTASFVGMVFTIQFVREFARLGLTRSVGGVLALALARELSPVVTAIILAGRVGSAFAAELGTMQVSEQTDTLRVLRTDPVDYLITPRVIACCISLPILTIICFSVGMAASVLLADSVYSVSSNIILESAARALQPWDLISTTIKSVVFGGIISIISCAWGVTTAGGAKGVGESTTSAVVISLVCIFIADFILSYAFFQGAGDALKAAMG